MRKLSIGPLFILLVIFLISRFASAAVQDLQGRQLPTKRAAKSRAKLAAKLPAKKTTVAQALPQKLPQKLPALKATRVQINFEEIPSTPLEQSVVIVAPAPEIATVEQPLLEILPSEPTNELWQQDPNAVAAQPLTEVDLPETFSATSSSLSDLEAIAAAVAADAPEEIATDTADAANATDDVEAIDTTATAEDAPEASAALSTDATVESKVNTASSTPNTTNGPLTVQKPTSYSLGIAALI